MPTMKFRTLLICGALLLLIGVAAGAFGAHALRNIVPAPLLGTWNTAVLYQLVHGLGILITVQLYLTLGHGLFRIAAWTMLVATLLFSGSLYLLILTSTRWLAFVTPFGGVLFLTAWLLVIIAAWSAGKSDRHNQPK